MGQRIRILLVLLLIPSCGDVSHPKWEQLHALRSSLRSHAAAPFSRDQLRRFETRYWELKRAFASASRWTVLPSEDRILEERLNLCIDWAGLILKQLERNRQRIRSRQESFLGSIGRSLDRLSSGSTDPELRKLLVPAELKLIEARSQWELENYDRVDSLIGPLAEFHEAAESHWKATAARFEDPVLRELWKEWADETVRHSARTRSNALVVDKLRGSLFLYRNGRLVKRYPVDLGRTSARGKLHRGDGATPEGRYRVTQKLGPGETSYFRAFLLDYPNSRDRRIFNEARRVGVVPDNASIGERIEIHGAGGKSRNWTDGCIALSNHSMRELYDLGFPGMRVTIVGTVDE